MAVGDILIHQSVRNSAALPNGSYDFKPAFELVAPIFRQADLVIGNLENPLAGSAKGYSGYPMFNAPEQLAQNLKDVGFTSLNLTNNHSLDRGLEGLKSTIAYVREAKLDYSGAYLDEEDKKNRLVSFYNGVGVALLGYTYGLNVPYKVEPGLEWRLGVIDKEQVERDVAAARATGADFVVVSLHFGNEYELKPNAGQRALAEALFNSPNGAPDLILGHHPHVVQPFVEFKDKSQAVIFSLGNFISSQPFPYTFLGLILDLRLTIHPDGHKSIEEINFIPTYCHKIQLKGASRRIFRVTPMAVAAASPKSYSLDDKTAKTMAVHLAQQLTHLKSLDAESLKAASSAPSSPKVPSINQAAAEVSN
jgi:poly-gamma-glutamate synthesis protein (capsule biosynthesis protein)